MTSTEYTSHVMATMTEDSNNQHVSLVAYVSPDESYITYTVAAHDTESGWTYWSQWDDKESAVADYNEQWVKLFQ